VDDLLQEVPDCLVLPQDGIAEPSLEDFERGVDALAEDLEHLPVCYQRNYSREDINLDHN